MSQKLSLFKSCQFNIAINIWKKTVICSSNSRGNCSFSTGVTCEFLQKSYSLKISCNYKTKPCLSVFAYAISRLNNMLIKWKENHGNLDFVKLSLQFLIVPSWSLSILFSRLQKVSTQQFSLKSSNNNGKCCKFISKKYIW